VASGDAVMAQLSALVGSPHAAGPVDEQGLVVCDRRKPRFRAQFLGLANDSAPIIVGMANLRASEARGAMREAITMVWPPQAIGFRLLDSDR
jgi:hypothetical protein